MSRQSSPVWYSFGHPWTPAVKQLIIANTIVFIFQNLFAPLPLWPWLALQVPEVFVHLRLWQFFTYLFLHGGFWHLAFNLFTLWMFGCDVELRLGTRRFYLYYFFTGVGAGLIVAALSLWSGERGATIGSSGAIFGVLMAYGVLFAEKSLTLLLFFVVPVSMKARTLVIFFAVFELLAGVARVSGTVSHLAHLSGLMLGYLYFLIQRRQLPFSGNWWQGLRIWRLERKVKKIPLEDDLDAILDKISRQGINSLTDRERKILTEASKQRNHRWPGEN